MSHKTILASIITCIAAPAFVGAQELGGDAQAGDQLFGRQCVACHVVADPDGNVLAGRNARTGPNLYAIDGRVLGGIEDFRYSDGLVALGAEGAVWDEASFVGFVQDATGWVREATGDTRARSKMAYRVRSAEDAADIYAYLVQLAAE